MTKKQRFWLASDPGDFERLGLDPNHIGAWEDGQRISADPNNLEWWYLDAHLDDGTTLVVQFYARPPFEPMGEFAPKVTVQIDFPDGRNVTRTYTGSAADFHAQIGRCDVRVGTNSFTGDLSEYHVHAEIDDLVLNLVLRSTVPPFRLGTSHTYAGKDGEEKLFAWLPAVPQGEVETTIQIGDKLVGQRGIGYHDHNWGTAPMWEIFHHWYWARAKIGPWTVIAAFLIAEETYGHAEQVNFFLARDGKIVAADFENTRFSAADIHPDDTTGKPVADRIAFDLREGEDQYQVSFARERTIVQAKLIDALPAPAQEAARRTGFDGAYLRFTGQARLEHRRADALVEESEEQALWELMYFGKTTSDA